MTILLDWIITNVTFSPKVGRPEKLVSKIESYNNVKTGCGYRETCLLIGEASHLLLMWHMHQKCLVPLFTPI